MIDLQAPKLMEFEPPSKICKLCCLLQHGEVNGLHSWDNGVHEGLAHLLMACSDGTGVDDRWECPDGDQQLFVLHHHPSVTQEKIVEVHLTMHLSLWQKQPKVVRNIWCQMHFQGDDRAWLVFNLLDFS